MVRNVAVPGAMLELTKIKALDKSVDLCKIGRTI